MRCVCVDWQGDLKGVCSMFKVGSVMTQIKGIHMRPETLKGRMLSLCVFVNLPNSMVMVS